MDGDKVLGENIKKNTDECIRVIEEAMFDIKLGDANEIENFQDDRIMQKPDYADAFEDNLIFKWDSQIGKDNSSPYMQKVLTAPKKHLLVKKSDAETGFYYMGQFDIVESADSQKEDNNGKMKPIAKVTMKMHHPVREDLLRYLQSNISKENKAV